MTSLVDYLQDKPAGPVFIGSGAPVSIYRRRAIYCTSTALGTIKRISGVRYGSWVASYRCGWDTGKYPVLRDQAFAAVEEHCRLLAAVAKEPE